MIIQTQTANAQSEWGYCEHNYYYGTNICSVQSVWNMQMGSAAWYVQSTSGNFYWNANVTLNNSGWANVWISSILYEDLYGPTAWWRSGVANVGTSPTWVDVQIQIVNGNGTMGFSW
jgi:hypothetical protein